MSFCASNTKMWFRGCRLVRLSHSYNSKTISPSLCTPSSHIRSVRNQMMSSSSSSSPHPVILLYRRRRRRGGGTRTFVEVAMQLLIFSRFALRLRKRRLPRSGCFESSWPGGERWRWTTVASFIPLAVLHLLLPSFTSPLPVSRIGSCIGGKISF